MIQSARTQPRSRCGGSGVPAAVSAPATPPASGLSCQGRSRQTNTTNPKPLTEIHAGVCLYLNFQKLGRQWGASFHPFIRCSFIVSDHPALHNLHKPHNLHMHKHPFQGVCLCKILCAVLR